MTHQKPVDDAVSPVVAELLLTVLTIVLTALLLLLALSMIPAWNDETEPSYPEYFIITKVRYDEAKVTLKNIGDDILNDEFYAEVYINDVNQHAIIETLNGYKFISTHHFKVSKIQGAGVTGDVWKTGKTAVFDLENGMIKPGDILRIDICRKSDNSLYSSTKYLCP